MITLLFIPARRRFATVLMITAMDKQTKAALLIILTATAMSMELAILPSVVLKSLLLRTMQQRPMTAMMLNLLFIPGHRKFAAMASMKTAMGRLTKIALPTTITLIPM